ncbi:MAG: glycosyltransferase, partial [Deltaproteobacteria bacterium]|nr:glycosyltransferase [Deltaproteobacteria bacterium]
MRILHIDYGFDYPFPGGAQKRVFEECRRLAQTDELLLVYSSSFTDWRGTKKEFDSKNIPFKTVSLDIREIFQPWRRNLARTLLLPVRKNVAKPIISTIKSFKPDIVHLHAGGGRSLINAVYAAKATNIPIVLMMHNHWPLCVAIGYFDFKSGTFCKDEIVCGRCLNVRFKTIVSFLYRNRFARYVLKHVDHYICYTEFTKSLLAKAGVASEKVTVIPPGIENVRIKNTVDFSQRKYITFSGRISP